jgi:hypothetical protein
MQVASLVIAEQSNGHDAAPIPMQGGGVWLTAS